MSQILVRTLTLVGVVLALLACGQQGPLYLPSPPKVRVDAPAAAKQALPPAVAASTAR